MLTRDEFGARYGRPALFGMVHLQPLPGSPLWRGSLEDVTERARKDAAVLTGVGFDGLVIENFGDRPFSKSVGPETVAAMSIIIDRISADTDLILGINVLRNDARSALAIATATSASFIRINVHVGTMATDQGLIEGEASGTLRLRHALEAERIAIFADLLVKHARPVVEIDAVDAARDLRERGLADAILLTGRATGAAVDIDLVRDVRSAVDAPLVLASGVSIDNVAQFAGLVDGFIIGTSIKEEARSDAPVDHDRARRIVSLLK